MSLPWSKPGLFCHFSSLSSSPVCLVQETISRQRLHLRCTSKAKKGRSAAPILAAIHHILKLFLEPKKHITHFILLLVKEELVANTKRATCETCQLLVSSCQELCHLSSHQRSASYKNLDRAGLASPRDSDGARISTLKTV